MPFSVLSHMFNIERTRARLNRSATAGGFATPALGEVQLRPEEQAPLVTNMRGTFLVTHKSKDDVARFGFTPCSVEDEGTLLTELARVLWDLSPEKGWTIRCTSVPGAVESLKQAGLEARTLVVSSQVAKTVLGQANLPLEGFVGIVGQMQVIVTSLPESVSLVALAPMKAGYCVRAGENVGLAVRPEAFRVVQT